MKLVLKIAAGIVVAMIFLWVCGLVLTAGALKAASESLPQLATSPAAVPVPIRQYSQAQMNRWNAQTDAEAVRERAQEQRCTVMTADGRELHCDPHGPFTPR